MIIKDIHGNKIRKGMWLMSISEQHSGEVLPVVIEGGELAFPECNGLSCGVPLKDFTDENGVLTEFVKIRDPYQKMGYPEAVKTYNVELQNAGVKYEFSADELNAEQTAHLNRLGYDIVPFDDPEYILADILTMADAGIDPDEIGCSDGWYKDTCTDIMHTFIKEADNYLVFAMGCRWTGASGYFFAERVEDTIYRRYPVTIRPIAATPNGKTLVCKESSHDVPMGGTTVIIALTDREYKNLSSAEFADIQEFAERKYQQTRRER